jgi:AcrR family transcriptional regulator
MIHKRRATTRRVSPGRPRNPDIDSAILRAALEVFRENGLDGVGIEQVAERAGVARTTVYRRWISKESLIAEAIAKGRGAAEEKVLHSPISRHATVKGVVDALSVTVSSAEYRQIVARLIGSIPDHPRLMAVYWQAYLVPRRKIAANALEQARAEGLIRKDTDTEILLDLLGGAIMYRVLIYPDRSGEKDIRLYLLKLMKELGIDDSKRAGST